jgi:hypothetical protein
MLKDKMSKDKMSKDKMSKDKMSKDKIPKNTENVKLMKAHSRISCPLQVLGDSQVD